MVGWGLLYHWDKLYWKVGSSLFPGNVPTHTFPEASPDLNPTLTQTLDLTQGRVGTWSAAEQGLKSSVSHPTENAIEIENQTIKKTSTVCMICVQGISHVLCSYTVGYQFHHPILGVANGTQKTVGFGKV